MPKDGTSFLTAVAILFVMAILGLAGDFVSFYFRGRRPITRGEVDGEEVDKDHDYKID